LATATSLGDRSLDGRFVQQVGLHQRQAVVLGEVLELLRIDPRRRHPPAGLDEALHYG